MSILFIDGAELGSTGLWTSASYAASSSSKPAGFTGTYFFDSGGNNTYTLAWNIGSNKSEIYVSFMFYCTLAATDAQLQPLIFFKDSGGTTIFSVSVDVSSNPAKMKLTRGNSGSATVGDLGTADISWQTAYHVQVWLEPLNSDGHCQVKVDGVLDIDYTGDTTGGLENVREIWFGYSGANGCRNVFDDIVIDDADWPGIAKVQGIVPSGAGTTTQWDPSTGSNYACVDERPPSDTDYVSTNTTDEIDLYAMGDLTGAIDSILGISVAVRAGYDGSPTPTDQQVAIRTNSTNYFSSNLGVGASFSVKSNIWELNPNTSAAWSESEINSLECGVKAVA